MKSELGQREQNSVRVYVFRFAHKLRHCSTQAALRICARLGSRATQSRLPLFSQQRKFVEASGASALPRSTDIRIDDAKGELGDCVGSRGLADPGIQEALGLPCKRGARASRSLEMISFSSWPSAETLLPFALQSLPVHAGGFCSAKLSSAELCDRLLAALCSVTSFRASFSSAHTAMLCRFANTSH